MSMRKPAKVLVRGNGAKTIAPVSQTDVVIGFNQTQAAVGTSAVTVASTAQAPLTGSHFLRLDTTAKCLGPWLDALQINAGGQLAKQTAQLGCLPSTGFMAVHSLWDLQIRVSVDGMNFDPSLERSLDLPTRKPLPQMFHNWLGERRLSLARWLSAPPQNWNWPLTGMQALQGNGLQEPGGGIPHVEILVALLEAQQSGTLSRLAQMLELPVKPSECLLQDAPETRQLERCFHLQRHLNETPNWWLYDHAGSVIINQLAQRLRSAQRQIFLALSMHARQAG